MESSAPDLPSYLARKMMRPPFLPPSPASRQRAHTSHPAQLPPPSQRGLSPAARPRRAISTVHEDTQGMLVGETQQSNLFSSQERRLSQDVRRPSSQFSIQEGVGCQQMSSARYQAPDLTETYRPGPASSRSSTPLDGPKNAAELFMQNREPKVSMGDKLMSAISDLNPQFEAVHDIFADISSDSKRIRDQLHDLQEGQKVLATTEEVREEVTGQLSPALHDFFQSLRDRLDMTLESLPQRTAEFSVKQIGNVIMEMRAADARSRGKDADFHQPLISLMNHLISKLDTVNTFQSTLASFQDLPQALRDVATFRSAMDALASRHQQLAPHHSQPAAILAIDGSPKVIESISSLRQSLDEFKDRVQSTPPQTDQADIRRLILDVSEIKQFMTTSRLAAIDLQPNLTPSHQTASDSPLNTMLSSILSGINDIKLMLQIQATQPAASGSDAKVEAVLKTIQTSLGELRADPRALLAGTHARTPLSYPVQYNYLQGVRQLQPYTSMPSERSSVRFVHPPSGRPPDQLNAFDAHPQKLAPGQIFPFTRQVAAPTDVFGPVVRAVPVRPAEASNPRSIRFSGTVPSKGAITPLHGCSSTLQSETSTRQNSTPSQASKKRAAAKRTKTNPTKTTADSISNSIQTRSQVRQASNESKTASETQTSKKSGGGTQEEPIEISSGSPSADTRAEQAQIPSKLVLPAELMTQPNTADADSLTNFEFPATQAPSKDDSGELPESQSQPGHDFFHNLGKSMSALRGDLRRYGSGSKGSNKRTLIDVVDEGELTDG